MIGELSYGDVTLDLTWIDLSRRPIRSDDDTTYLWTEYVFDVLCVYNPKATSFRGNNAGNRQPVFSNTAFAGSTDISLREYLAQPRRTLEVQYGDDNGNFQTFLKSPSAGVTSDAKGGPFCEVMSIQEHHGTRTWIMHLQFKTYVTCEDSASPVLSHRFRKVVDVDEDGFATIVTSGEAIFHVGRLWTSGQSPDFWRQQFFTAPPIRFAREHINVEVSEGNDACRYTVVDRERAFSFGADSPATQIDAWLTTGYEQGSRDLIAGQMATSLLGRLSDAASLALAGGGLSPGEVFRVNAGILADARAAVAANVPKYWCNIRIKARGSTDTTRYDLLKMCIGISVAKLGRPNFVSTSNRTEWTVSQQLTGKEVQYEMTLRWTNQVMLTLLALQTVLDQEAAARDIGILLDNTRNNGGTFLFPYFRGPEEMIDIPNKARLQQQQYNRPIGGIETPQNAANVHARGAGYLKKLVVNGLSGQCENPPIVGSTASIPTASEENTPPFVGPPRPPGP